MKVLGISASPRKDQTTDRLVREILSTVEAEKEFISLAGKRISPCIACLGCGADNICKVRDDMAEFRPLLIEADAIVFGAPNYYGMINGLAHCFLERFYQFRHQEKMTLEGKLGIAAGVGGRAPEAAIRDIEKIFISSRIEMVGSIAACGANSCYTCGYGETCRVSAVYAKYGPGIEICDDIIPDLSKQSEVIEKAHELGRLMSRKLNSK